MIISEKQKEFIKNANRRKKVKKMRKRCREEE